MWQIVAMAMLRRLVPLGGKNSGVPKLRFGTPPMVMVLSLYMLIFAIGLVDYFMNEAKALMPVWLGLRARAEARNVRALAALPMP